MRTIRGLGAALAVLATVTLAPTARADVGIEPANHAFVGSPAGYIGCFEVVNGPAGVCIEAYSSADGVHVSWFGPLSVEEAVDPLGQISATTDTQGRRRLTIDATLPTAGAVHVVSTGGQA